MNDLGPGFSFFADTEAFLLKVNSDPAKEEGQITSVGPSNSCPR